MVSRYICYVPELQPDELLYSFLGRLIAYNALYDPRTYLQLLFGTRDIVPGIDLPTRLAPLQQYLGAFSPFASTDELIDVGTLYPYHRPFLTTERHEAVQQILLMGGGKGLKTLMGRVANRFGASPPLRFCTSCASEDIIRHGAPYWRRSHQLPGVTCCIQHRVELVIHDHPKQSGDKRRLLLVPAQTNATNSRRTCGNDQLRFAVLSKDLLDARLPVVSPQQRRQAYLGAALQLGFRSRGNHVDHDGLVAALRNHYGDFWNFAHRDRLLSSPKNPMRWLSTLLDNPAKSSHPICHLILVGFLFGTIDAFRQALRVKETVDCSSTDSRCQILSAGSADEFRELHSALLRDASISCRRTASLLNVSVNMVVLHRRYLGVPIAERRKHLHPDRVSAIGADLARGMAPSSLAKQHRVSVSTVYRVRAQLLNLSEMHAKARHARELEKRRRTWRQAMARHGNYGLRVVRAAAAAAYAWLYRHDRAWLLKSTDSRRSVRHPKPWVDWGARDVALCGRLLQHIECLKSEWNRPRISKTLMLRVVGDAMIRANFERLPRLTTMIQAFTESQESFRIFRIDRAIRQLCADTIPIRLWRILRLAGIRSLTPALQNYIESRMRDL